MVQYKFHAHNILLSPVKDGRLTMVSPPIPDDIRRYLVQCVPSVPYIEAVLLMREDRHAWQPDALARRLYLNEDDTQRLLARMRADGIIAGDSSGLRYSPASADLDELWTRLAVVYAHHLIEVSTLIHTKPGGKAQMLADAFVWRKAK
jgi:hypothetical protein